MSGLGAQTPLFAQLTEVYEAMRQIWCGHEKSGCVPFGLDVLLRRGMNAWIDTTAGVLSEAHNGCEPSASLPRPAAGAGTQELAQRCRRQDLAALVASMALAVAMEEGR